MGREVPYYESTICDACGASGAYDFMGDFYCPTCCAENDAQAEAAQGPDPSLIEQLIHKGRAETGR